MDSGFADIRKNINGPEVHLLPFQRAIDMEIIARSQSGNTSPLPSTVNDITFTEHGQQYLINDRTNNFLFLCIFIFGAIFAFAMVGIVYHMTSFVATERELGMSNLIDAMLPGGSASRARLVRQISTYLSFAIVYFPSWLAIGIIISVVVFPNTTRGIPVGYHIFSGLAFCSYSLFGASFFKKAQLSGSIMVIIALVFAILPQTIYEQKPAMVYIFSLLFPSANYTYFLITLATWEASNTKVDLMGKSPWGKEYADQDGRWSVRLFILWIFTALQIVIYPVLAFLLERALFSTASPGRTFARPADAHGPTVTLSGFYKT